MLTQERVRELFDYNPDTGDLIRRITTASRAIAGDKVGNKHPTGYLLTGIDGNLYPNHRIIWLWYYGYMPENDIDHKDRIKSNNRLCNLREVSKVCNSRNTGNRVNTKSGVKGVCWYKRDNKWRVQGCINGKTHTIGYHTNFDEAVCHRLAFEQCVGWEGCDSSSPAFKYIYSARERNSFPNNPDQEKPSTDKIKK